MKTSLRLTSVVIFFIGAYLITAKIADTAAAVDSHTTDNHGLTNIKPDSQLLKQVISSANLDSEYEPPNYGGPDSQHGSGTR